MVDGVAMDIEEEVALVDLASASTSGAVLLPTALGGLPLPANLNHLCHPLASPLLLFFHCVLPRRRDATVYQFVAPVFNEPKK